VRAGACAYFNVSGSTDTETKDNTSAVLIVLVESEKADWLDRGALPDRTLFKSGRSGGDMTGTIDPLVSIDHRFISAKPAAISASSDATSLPRAAKIRSDSAIEVISA